MAISHESVYFSVSDCKIYPLITDVASASPTYGTGVDVPGISDFSFEPGIVSAEIKGDGRIVAKKGYTDRFSLNATYSKMSSDVLKVILGGSTTADTGVTPNQVSTYGMTNANNGLPLFKVAVQIDELDVGLGSATFTFYKCQLTGGSLLSQSQDGFGAPTFTADAFQPESATTNIFQMQVFETATALPA